MGFEDSLNRLTDMDWGWWPFLRLRPQKSVPMTTAYVARIAVAFGGFYGSALGVLSVLCGRATWPAVPVVMAAMVAFYLVLYRLTFAVAWNVRVARLASGDLAEPHPRRPD